MTSTCCSVSAPRRGRSTVVATSAQSAPPMSSPVFANKLVSQMSDHVCEKCGHTNERKRPKRPTIRKLRELLDFDLKTSVPKWRTGRFAGHEAPRAVMFSSDGGSSCRAAWRGRRPRPLAQQVQTGRFA